MSVWKEEVHEKKELSGRIRQSSCSETNLRHPSQDQEIPRSEKNGVSRSSSFGEPLVHNYSVSLKNTGYLAEDDEKPPESFLKTSPNHMQHENVFFTSRFAKQAVVMSLWFFCSFSTIVLNKYILTTLDGDPGILGECQILMTTFFGSIMMYLPFCRAIKSRSTKDYFNRYHFFKTISLLGWLRFGAIACSVISLKYVAVSFSETIKSSAPLFTAICAYILLGEYSGIYVNLSLLPIMFGLAISTSTELSFNFTGFIAAIINNLLDCIQNVFSKKLLSGDDPKFSPLELQFYTSVAATVVQMPFWFFFMDIHSKMHEIDQYMLSMLLFNGIIFYAQSLFAYLLMSLISPVTFSVSNTVKRACLIWFSILVFGNQVTLLSALGTCLVVAGVFMYQRARHLEAAERLRFYQARSGKILI